MMGPMMVFESWNWLPIFWNHELGQVAFEPFSRTSFESLPLLAHVLGCKSVVFRELAIKFA